MKSQNKTVYYHDLGLISYEEGLNEQLKHFEFAVEKKLSNRKNDTNDTIDNHILFCEHPHTYTLGRSGAEEHLLINNKTLQEKGATFHKIGRGGDITYHGPGQLVGYPILDLDSFFTDIHKYLRFLEEAIILTCKDYGIDVGRIDGLTGVWVDHEKQNNPRKICAMGVKASRWITMHGFALNVNTDLSYFGHIVPCGITGKDVTSLERELGKKLDIQEVKSILLQHIAHLFEMNISQ